MKISTPSKICPTSLSEGALQSYVAPKFKDRERIMPTFSQPIRLIRSQTGGLTVSATLFYIFTLQWVFTVLENSVLPFHSLSVSISSLLLKVTQAPRHRLGQWKGDQDTNNCPIFRSVSRNVHGFL